MKKLCFIFLIITISTIRNSNVSALEDIQKSIKVGGDNHLPPYQYVNDNGVYKGFSVDIIHAIAIEMGLDIELSPMPFYSIITDIQKNRIDVILGIEKLVDYQDEFIFSDPYLTISKGIFVKKTNQYIIDLEDLAMTKVIVQRGNIPKEIIDIVKDNNIVYVDNQQQGILALMMGNADAFIGNRLTGSYTIQKWKQTNFIKVVGEQISPIDYCFATKKENSEIIYIFNEGIKRIKRNGTYEKIYNKWFGEILKSPQEIRNEIFKKVIVLFSVLVVFFAMVFRWNNKLRVEVRKRTKELDEANKSLIQSNEKLEVEYLLRHKIINSVFHGVLTILKDGTVTFKNTKACALLYIHDEKELDMKKIHDTLISEIIPKEHIENVFELNQIYIENEKVIKVNGEEKIFMYSIYPLFENKNNFAEAVILFKDISREKRIQEQLIQRDKIHALGEFMAVVAHEIRNPLMTIKTYVDLISTKIDKKEFREKFTHYVPVELNRIEQLVIDLLNYSKPKKSKKTEFQVDNLIKEIFHLFDKKIEEKNILIDCLVEPNTIIYADRNQVKQVLINLILNSIQAFEKEHGHVIVKAFNSGNNCIIKIIDDGKGIDPIIKERIFEPFNTNRSAGTGLGLSICNQILKEHGGYIDIQSTINEGTKIKLIFPNIYM